MNPLIEFTKWLFKWLGIFLAGLAVLVLAWAGVAWGWHWYSHQRHADKIQVVVVKKGAPEGPAKYKSGDNPVAALCTDTFPIFVGFTNNSERTVEYIRINVSARRPGHSTNILSYDSYMKMDRIVPPGEGYGYCGSFEVQESYKSFTTAAEAEYSGEISDVRFREH